MKIILTILLILNLIVSIFLAKRDDLEFHQKLCQIIVVWIIPFFGAIGLYLFYRTQDQKAKSYIGEFGGGPGNGSVGSPGGGDGG